MLLERIVVGVDFSEPSIAAAHWTSRHLAPRAELVLVHSVEIPRPPSFLRTAFHPSDELEKSARQGAEQRLRELGERLAGDRIWPVVRSGRAADQIAAVAQEMEADLIVVGEHGRRGGLWGTMGSTAEALARSAPTPVLLAHHLPEGRPERILLPVEESALARRALAWGRFLGETWSARAIGYYVIPSSLVARMRAISSPAREQELEDLLLRDAAGWLEARLAEAGFAEGAADAHVVIGDPATEVVAAAQRYGVDLIVMASRGGGAVGEALIGSVARSVLRGAPCPILIVNQGADRDAGG
jgi:nucleotide-binding universal stress UspA family protein